MKDETIKLAPMTDELFLAVIAHAMEQIPGRELPSDIATTYLDEAGYWSPEWINATPAQKRAHIHDRMEHATHRAPGITGKVRRRRMFKRVRS
jgi:hypothetical protein